MDPTDVGTMFLAGASGATGLSVLRLLGPRDVSVRALTRSPGNEQRLRQAGADDVVVSAVGSDVSDIPGGGPYVDGVGTRNPLDAAVEAGVEAFVMESAIGVGDDPASPLARGFDLFLGPVQRAKAASEAALRAAPVRHTILRPGVLTNGSRTDDVTVAEPGAKLWGAVSRADVARLLAAAPVTGAAAGRTFEVVSVPSFRERGVSVDWTLPA